MNALANMHRVIADVQCIFLNPWIVQNIYLQNRPRRDHLWMSTCEAGKQTGKLPDDSPAALEQFSRTSQTKRTVLV